jgi:hypothetical protein
VALEGAGILNAISALTLALPAGSVIPNYLANPNPNAGRVREGLCVQNRMVSIYALPTSLERMRGGLPALGGVCCRRKQPCAGL